MCEGAFRSQEGHPQRLLQTETGAHDLLEDRAHGRSGKGAGVLGLQAGEDFPLAFRGMEEGLRRGFGFQAPHLGGEARPAVEERQHLVVHRVDGPAEVGQGLRVRLVHAHSWNVKPPSREVSGALAEAVRI